VQEEFPKTENQAHSEALSYIHMTKSEMEKEGVLFSILRGVLKNVKEFLFLCFIESRT
jgi:hypothetical protein